MEQPQQTKAQRLGEKIASLLGKKDTPEPETAPQPTPVATQRPQLSDFKVENMDELLKLFYALGTSRHYQCIGVAGTRRAGRILGAKSYKEEMEMWAKIKAYLTKEQTPSESQSQNVPHGEGTENLSGGSKSVGGSEKETGDLPQANTHLGQSA